MGTDFTETVKPLQLPFIVSGVYLNGAGVRNARMDVYQTRKDRLRQFVARFEKQADAAERLKRSPSQLAQLLGGKNIGAWLARELEKLAGDPSGSWDFPQEPPAVNEPSARYGSEYLYVGRVDGPRLSAGRGEVIWDFEEVDRSHAFRADWMRRMGLRPDRCKLLEVRGDSMAPTINDGDLVMVNMADRSVINGEVYAVVTDDGLRVKRLQRRADGLIWMLSDNPQQQQYPPEPVASENAAIIGRVVHRSGSLIKPTHEELPVREMDILIRVAEAFGSAKKDIDTDEFKQAVAWAQEMARQSGRLPTIKEVLGSLAIG